MLLYPPPWSISTQCSTWRLFSSPASQRQFPVSFVVWFLQAFVSLDQHHLCEKYLKPISHSRIKPSSSFKCSLLLLCNDGCDVFKIHPFPLHLHGDQTITLSSLAVLLGLFPAIISGIRVVLGADVFNVFWMHCKGREIDNRRIFNW